jgi:hypothetical protein
VGKGGCLTTQTEGVWQPNGGCLATLKDRPKFAADSFVADPERPGLFAPDAQLKENRDRKGVAQEAPEHEVPEQAAVLVGRGMARDSGGQDDRRKTSLAPHADVKLELVDWHELVDDEMQRCD